MIDASHSLAMLDLLSRFSNKIDVCLTQRPGWLVVGRSGSDAGHRWTHSPGEILRCTALYSGSTRMASQIAGRCTSNSIDQQQQDNATKHAQQHRPSHGRGSA
jgi:hypothetical protein